MRWMTAGLMNGAGAMGAMTDPSSPLRGASPIGLTLRTAAATPASLIRIAGSVILPASFEPATAARLWKVPPDMPSEGLGMPPGGVTCTSRSMLASPSPQRSRAASVAIRTSMSGGSASKPHT